MKYKIVVHMNNMRTIMFIFMSIIICVLSFICLISNPESYYVRTFWFFSRNPVGIVVGKALFLVCFVYFLLYTVILLKRMVSGNAVLAADSRGIIDNSSINSLGVIFWDDIEDMYMGRSRGNRFIEVKLKNEKKYLLTCGWFKRLRLKLNKLRGHQMICISLYGTDSSNEEILPMLLEILDEKKAEGKPEI